MIPKFRAWRKDGKEMGKVGRIIFNLDGSISNVHFKGEFLDFDFTMNNVILMQSTGMVDKNDQEIFEGDILTDEGDELEDGWVYVSVISKDGMYYCQENNTHGISGPLIEFSQYYSIVGNIYENPELLENKGE